jgi:hypothetical protein
MNDLDCELRIAKCENGLQIAKLKRLDSSIFRNSPSAFCNFVFRFSPFASRNFPIGVCPKSGQARGPAPTKDIELRNADCEKTGHHFSFFAIRLPPFAISHFHCRGNPLWLPKIRAGTGACPYKDFSNSEIPYGRRSQLA